MKKLLILSGVTAVIVGLVGVASAASGTISLSPMAKNVSVGQTVAVAVTVNPSSGSVYTVKAKIAYPANLLQVQSFEFSNGWLPLAQSGYDLVDNVNGVLIKTAGYAGGLSTPKTLGTITFKVKAAGTIAITVAGDSMLLDATNANVLSGRSGSTLISVQATSAPAPKVSSGTTTPSPSASVSPEASPSGEAATIIAGLSLGETILSGGGILVVIVLVVLWFLRRLRRRN